MRAAPDADLPESHIEVRLARSDEYEEIGRVTLSAWEPRTNTDDPAWKRFAEPIADVAGRARVADVFVALVGGRIAGSVTLELDERIPDHHGSAPLEPGEAHIRILGVASAFRRRGIAGRLVEECIAAARRAGKTRLTVNTSVENEVARSLYVAVGFTPQADVVRNGERVASYAMVLESGGYAAGQPRIRRADHGDATVLREMLAYAARWRAQEAIVAEDVVTHDALARYVEEWGRPGDVGVVAETEEGAIGAAWVRLFDRDRPGYGFIAEDTPELTIAMAPEWRRRGVGALLLRSLVAESLRAGFPALSLSVEPDNPAFRMYLRVGFEPIGERQGSWTMRLDLAPEPDQRPRGPRGSRVSNTSTTSVEGLDTDGPG